MQKYAKLCRNMQNYTEICKIMQKYAGLCNNMWEYTYPNDRNLMILRRDFQVVTDIC